jgi:hypothetical protein
VIGCGLARLERRLTQAALVRRGYDAHIFQAFHALGGDCGLPVQKCTKL